MFNRQIIQKALKQTWDQDSIPGGYPDKSDDVRDSVTSKLIYDIFGGEILKTRKKKKWHFYNLIDGERIDFTGSEPKSSANNRFEDIPSSPEETFNYFAQEDYSNLFMKFIRIFEEAVGLDPIPGR